MRTSKSLLERKGEVEAFTDAAAHAREGRGSVVLVEGEPGVGKTRLLTAARAIGARLGFIVLSARGAELERNFGFGVVRQLFEQVVSGTSAQARRRLFVGAAALAAPLLGSGEGAEPARDAQDALLHGLYWLTVRISERAPLLLEIDDAHWADAPSLRFIAYLARRIDGLPVVVALASRTTEPQAERALIDALKEVHAVRELRPQPLSEGASATLVQATFPSASDALCSRCHEASGGNPFLLQELVAELDVRTVDPRDADVLELGDVAPEAVRRSLLARLALLPEAAPKLAEAAAILESATLAEVVELAGVSLEEAAPAADQLVASRLLGSVEPVEFAHPLMRSAVYAEIPPAERAIRHLGAAKLLAERGSPAEEVAAHLMRAVPSGDSWAIETLMAAAEEARSRGTPDTRVAYLRRVLEGPLERDRRFELELELGRAMVEAGSPEGLAHLQSVFDRSRQTGLRTEAALSIAWALQMSGETRRAAELLAHGMDELSATSPPDAARLGVELIMLTDVDLNAATFVADRLDAAERLLHKGPPTIVSGHEAVTLGKRGESADRAAEAAQASLADGSLFELGMAGSPYYLLVVSMLTYADRIDEALSHHERTIAEARRRGLVAPFVIGSTQRAYAHGRRGSLDEAEADARIAVDAARLHGFVPFELMAVTSLLLTLADRDPAAGIQMLREADTPLDEIEHTQVAVLIFSRGHLRLAHGDMALAADDLLEAGRRFTEWGLLNPIFDWRSGAALALLASGERGRALDLVSEEVERARRWGTPRAIGVALRAQGLIEGGEQGVELLREAVAILESSQARLEHARASTDLGALLRRKNRRTEAREPLRLGLDLARRCGAHVLAERARQELVAAGARPRRERLTGADSLTPTERRIALLAAEGKSNPEIAQDLFVTRKTVEFHLSNAYRKLGIHSRDQLSESLRSDSKN
jgi:DNA-binding CsgD family transcriptional regulator